jgi:3-hydroxybutyrate dehydrogenase
MGAVLGLQIFDLSGKRALVTGSSQGIGFALAQGLAAAGAEVVLNGRDAAKLALAAERILGAKTLAFDATDHAAVRAAVDGFEAAVGPIDILVNNAGIQKTAALPDVTQDTWDTIIAVNLSAAFYTMQAAVPSMAARGYGRVINIASVHGLVGSKFKAPYVASKHGLIGLSKVVALEYASSSDAKKGGVTVNCICPGVVDTEMIRNNQKRPL